MEIYIVGAEGVFHYRAQGHSLAKLNSKDLRSDLAAASFDQSFILEAPITMVFTAIYQRTTNRYGERGRRYVHLDAGCAAENVHLQAEALGLGSVAVGAFSDQGVLQLLGLPHHEQPLYLLPLGYSKQLP